VIGVRSLKEKTAGVIRHRWGGIAAKQGCGSAAGLIAFLGFLAIVTPAIAGTTPVSSGGGGDPSLLGAGGILDRLYGLANLTRIDDFAALPNDQLWGNPNGGRAVARARFAEFANKLGYFAGSTSTTFVSLFTVSGSGFGVSGSAVFTNNQTGSPFRFALKTPAGDRWSSRTSDNTDALDHMVTFKITSGPDAGDFVIAWEDKPASSSDTDYNDLVIQVHEVFAHGCDSNSDCPDDGTQCTSQACVAGACVSTNLPSGTACTDGDACTSFDGSVGGADACDGSGACRGTAVVCTDGNQCTADTCVAGSCVSTNLPSGTACTDGDACTSSGGSAGGADACDGSGVCRGTAVACTDGNQCTADTCVAGSCVFTNLPSGAACTDGDACTSADACDGNGVCRGTVGCNDGNQCTTDACVAGACVFTNLPSGTACTDGDACTSFDGSEGGADVCDGSGVCRGTAVACTDGNQCTADTCVAGSCVFTNLASGTTCSDGDACTSLDGSAGSADACDGSGVCRGTAVVCSDGNQCTANTCVAGNCVVTHLPDGTPCDDADVCTTGDACSNGVCSGSAAPDGASCDDGNVCTENDRCTGGLCDGSPVDCSGAGGACNTATCDEGGAGRNCDRRTPLPDGTSCNDGNVCTASDTCAGGVCSGTPVPNAKPPVDIILVIEASLTMKRDLRFWIPELLGPLPSKLEEAGLTDWRLAIVRFGTSRRFATRPQSGPPVPDVYLDWTTDAAMFQTAVTDLRNNIRRSTEAGTEAIEFAIDKLAFRTDAVRNVILYTDEDDDSPVCQGSPVPPDFPTEACVLSAERREPPFRGPGCYGFACEGRWGPFQQRIDNLAARLIAGQVHLNIVENARNKPTIFQYGDPGCTRLVSNPADPRNGLLDVGPTLACLRSERESVKPAGVCSGNMCSQGRVGKNCATDSDCDALSLQAQLLGSGLCVDGACSAGHIGAPCSADTDCAILARAYRIPKSRSKAAQFFPAFINDKILEQGCRL